MTIFKLFAGGLDSKSDGLASQSLKEIPFGDGGECMTILKLFTGRFNFGSDALDEI